MSLDIGSLPEELIVEIFKYCDITSLGRLSISCRKFQKLIRYEKGLWLEKSRYVLGSNMRHPVMQKRCKPYLTPRRRCQLSKRWEDCNGDMRIMYRYPPCMPWLQFEEADHIYCSTGDCFVKFRRNAAGDIVPYRELKSRPLIHQDITKFVLKGKEIVAAFDDGMIGRWSSSDLQYIDSFEAHDDEIYSVHLEGNFMITGSRDRKIKVWKTDTPTPKPWRKYTRNMRARVLSTVILQSCRHFVAGLSGTNSVHPLQLFDLERGTHISNFGKTHYYGAGILDIYPEDPHTFLCCGYDTTVRLWDIRCPDYSCLEWMDPYDNSIYCVSSDHNVTVVSGANRHGLVHVWDKRRNTLSQFVRRITYQDSPVYSVAFDATHIFASLNRGIMQYSFNY